MLGVRNEESEEINKDTENWRQETGEIKQEIVKNLKHKKRET